MDKDILFAGISDEWLDILDNDELDNVLEQLNGIDSKQLTPPPCKLFEFARLCQLDKIKIVVVGQEPYSISGDAHGLAFSCLTKVPASLHNIYKCLIKNKCIETMPKSGNLTYWAEQGVLLLNSVLTTLIGKSTIHKKIWKLYTSNLIIELSNLKLKINGISFRPIFMFWGVHSKNSRRYMNKKCTILDWGCPSPLVQPQQTFLLCDHFTISNKLLKTVGPIDWNQSDATNIVNKYFGMTPRTTVAFTDGSCYPNKLCPDAIAGYASTFSLGVFKDVELYGNIDNKKNYATNQRAEGIAIYRVLQYLTTHKSEWDDCIIVSDTDFWIKMFTTYMPNWERNDIIFTEKKNSDLTVPMWGLYVTLTRVHDQTIEFRHVKSHNKDGWREFNRNTYEYFCWYNNDYVDKMAGYARKTLSPGIDIIDTVGYELNKNTFNKSNKSNKSVTK